MEEEQTQLGINESKMVQKWGLTQPKGLNSKNQDFLSEGIRKMEINKVDLLLKYILAAAEQEDFGNREVGPIHLIKYVYLADLSRRISEARNEKIVKEELNKGARLIRV